MKYCLIIGYPLKKPRSVKLWREFFKRNKMPIRMHARDIKKKFFKKEIKKLIKDPDFLASAITMPYKKEILPFLTIKDKITIYAKSVNFIIRCNEKIYGYNTDVYGALETLKKTKKDKIIIYGFGGAGEAIFRCMYKLYKKSFFRVVTQKKDIKGFKKKRVKFQKKIDKKFLSVADLFINCSPLGSNLKKNFIKKSPIHTNNFKLINKKIKVFDIVYEPSKTFLNKQCKRFSIKYVNGLKMNTLQAEKALNIISKKFKTDEKSKYSSSRLK